MAFRKMTQTAQDTGWGVIFRLNQLFAEIEDLSPAGKYDDWNIKLDRVWSNLLYKNSLEWVKDDDGNITDVKYCIEDIQKKNFLDRRILEAKKEMSEARKKFNNKDYEKTKGWIIGKKKLYKALMMKEIWIRKYMHEQGLYLKEVEYNPAGAMWGK
jgi:hypothetical protein